MSHEVRTLPGDAAEAVAALRHWSHQQPVLVFKKSLTCSISAAAERELERWLKERPDLPLVLASVDVLAQRDLARGLTAQLGVRHESPQALLFRAGALAWHDSHGALTAQHFRDRVDS